MTKGVPNDPEKYTAKRGEKNPRGAIKAASMSFREMLNDGGLKPSVFLLQRMRDENVDMPERVAIADKLVQYELPRLAAIEAEIETTGKTHDDYVLEYGADLTDDADEGRTLQ